MTEDSNKTLQNLKKVLAGKKGNKSEAPKEGASAEETPTPIKVLEQLKTAQDEAQESKDKLLRVLAEFENYKKRISKEHDERAKFSHEMLVKELIPVLDDFDRILEHLPETESPEVKNLEEGVQLVHRQLLKALNKFHLEEVEANDVHFDPHLHEAIAEVESEDKEAGVIVTCHRKGYRLHGRLLRPATVTIAKAKEIKESYEEE